MEQKKLGFGLMRLPLKDGDNAESIDMEALNKMVDTFMERGFTYFDTFMLFSIIFSTSVTSETTPVELARNAIEDIVGMDL